MTETNDPPSTPPIDPPEAPPAEPGPSVRTPKREVGGYFRNIQDFVAIRIEAILSEAAILSVQFQSGPAGSATSVARTRFVSAAAVVFQRTLSEYQQRGARRLDLLREIAEAGGYGEDAEAPPT